MHWERALAVRKGNSWMASFLFSRTERASWFEEDRRIERVKRQE